MAVSAVNLTTGASTANASPYATASISPNGLSSSFYLLAVLHTATTTVAPTVTGAGLTWTRITGTASGSSEIDLYRASGAGSAGALSIATTATTPTGASWQVAELTGVDLTGGEAAAVVQSRAVSNTTGTATTSADTLTSGITGGNASYAAIGVIVTATLSAGTNWTLLASTANTAPTTTFGGEQGTGGVGQQTMAFSWTVAGNYRIVGAEIKAAAAAAAAGFVNRRGPNYRR